MWFWALERTSCKPNGGILRFKKYDKIKNVKFQLFIDNGGAVPFLRSTYRPDDFESGTRPLPKVNREKGGSSFSRGAMYILCSDSRTDLRRVEAGGNASTQGRRR